MVGVKFTPESCSSLVSSVAFRSAKVALGRSAKVALVCRTKNNTQILKCSLVHSDPSGRPGCWLTWSLKSKSFPRQVSIPQDGCGISIGFV